MRLTGFDAAMRFHPPRHFLTPPGELALKLRDQRRRALIFGFLERIARDRQHQQRHRRHRQENRQRENGQKFAAEGHSLPIITCRSLFCRSLSADLYPTIVSPDRDSRITVYQSPTTRRPRSSFRQAARPSLSKLAEAAYDTGR